MTSDDIENHEVCEEELPEVEVVNGHKPNFEISSVENPLPLCYYEKEVHTDIGKGEKVIISCMGTTSDEAFKNFKKVKALVDKK